MSDLPPSTLPDEEKPGTRASDSDNQTVREEVQDQQTEDVEDNGVEEELSKEGQLEEGGDEQDIKEGVVNGEKDVDYGEDKTITPMEKRKEDEELDLDEEAETEDEEEHDSKDSENETSSKTGVYVVNQTTSQRPTNEQEQLDTKEEPEKVNDEQSEENEEQKGNGRNPAVTHDHKKGIKEEIEEDKDKGVDDEDNRETEEDSEEEEEEEEEKYDEEENKEGRDEKEEDGTGDDGNRNVKNTTNSTNEPTGGEQIKEESRFEVPDEEEEHKADNGEEKTLGNTVEKGKDPDSSSVKSTLKNEIGDNEEDLTSKFEENTKEYQNEHIDKEDQQNEQSNVFYDDKDENTEVPVDDLPKNDEVDKEILVIPPPAQVEDEQKKEQKDHEGEEEQGRKEETESKEKREEEDKDDQESDSEKKKNRRKQRKKQSTGDEKTKEYNKIGQKKDKEHRSLRSLTTVLVSRNDEEKKRTKNKSKSESQKMKNLARKRTKKIGTKGDKDGEFVIEDEDDMYSSDDMKQPGERNAPFIKQYNNKKRIEHILDQQHYWSDPEAEKESFGINESMTSIFGEGSTVDSGSDYEDLIGPDGTVHRVKKLKDVIDREQCSSDPLGNKRPKSHESLTSVEDPESPGGHISKKRLHEHYNGGEHGAGTANNENVNGKTEYAGLNDVKSKTRMVLVKENTLDDKPSRNDAQYKDVNNDKEDSDLPSDFCDTDMDKLSERDSGLDDEVEDAVDVVLNKEQQAMIVAMLFDEEMNLRPQFARDGNGRIIRRLDNTVIYDPHNGRFTFHRRLGRIFNIPRLRRNAKGRPTGGYIDDPFGPRESAMPRTPSSKLRLRTASGRSIRSHVTTEAGSPSPEMKRSRGEGKFVGFRMPEDDTQSLTSDQLAAHKRGRRDISSAIRRKLNKRLFRKKIKRPEPSALPDVVSKRAWTQEGIINGHDTTLGPRSLSSLSVPYSRTATGHGTLGAARKLHSNANLEQQEMFRQGLERDKRILEERQDILNKRPVEAFTSVDGEEDASENFEGETENEYYDPYRPAFKTSQSFYTDDGRLVVRERGCPELQRPATLFTIVRRQEDLEREVTSDAHNKGDNRDRFCKSAPSQVKPSTEQTFPKENTFHTVRQDGSESQLSGIDNNRLKKLLEELYKDKKYFDEYLESKEPESEEFIHSKGLAEHGRGYLLERAEYWERRGPLPPKPPMTEIGWKMHRQQTMLESRLNSDRSSTVLTLTPNSDQRQELNTLPGVVENQNGDLYAVESNESRA